MYTDIPSKLRLFAWQGMGRAGAFGVLLFIISALSSKNQNNVFGKGWVALVLLDCKYKYKNTKNTKLCLPGMGWEGLVLLDCMGSPSNATPAPRKGLRTL